jgi:hypothetical protein
MGTLFNQSPRDWHRQDRAKSIISDIDYLKEIQAKTGLSYDQVISTCNMLELRRKNDLYVANGDAFDEQMAGFGELLKEFIEAFKKAYNVSLHDDYPSALEAIAMTLGYEHPSAIGLAIEYASDNICTKIDQLSASL